MNVVVGSFLLISTVSNLVVTMWSPKARSDRDSRMSYSSVRLTKRVIDAASAGTARRIIWDSELRGFGVRVETSGTKTLPTAEGSVSTDRQWKSGLRLEVQQRAVTDYI